MLDCESQHGWIEKDNLLAFINTWQQLAWGSLLGTLTLHTLLMKYLGPFPAWILAPWEQRLPMVMVSTVACMLQAGSIFYLLTAPGYSTFLPAHLFRNLPLFAMLIQSAILFAFTFLMLIRSLSISRTVIISNRVCCWIYAFLFAVLAITTAGLTTIMHNTFYQVMYGAVTIVCHCITCRFLFSRPPHFAMDYQFSGFFAALFLAIPRDEYSFCAYYQPSECKTCLGIMMVTLVLVWFIVCYMLGMTVKWNLKLGDARLDLVDPADLVHAPMQNNPTVKDQKKLK